MAFLQVQFFSDALAVSVTVNMIMPEPKQGIGMASSDTRQLPKVLYLLHGYSDDHSIWMRRTSVERYASAHNLAVIMPAVNHSFYTNEKHGERYWDFVAQELPAAMHKFFRLSDKAEDTFVAGLSMGGSGARKLALTYPERFGAAASFSGAVDLVGHMLEKAGKNPPEDRVFGDLTKLKGSENDLFHLMEKNSTAPAKPRLYVACGDKDFLHKGNLLFVPALKKHGWDVTYHEEPGATHEWGFWDEQIKFFIPWMLGEK